MAMSSSSDELAAALAAAIETAVDSRFTLLKNEIKEQANELSEASAMVKGLQHDLKKQESQILASVPEKSEFETLKAEFETHKAGQKVLLENLLSSLRTQDNEIKELRNQLMNQQGERSEGQQANYCQFPPERSIFSATGCVALSTEARELLTRVEKTIEVPENASAPPVGAKSIVLRGDPVSAASLQESVAHAIAMLSGSNPLTKPENRAAQQRQYELPAHPNSAPRRMPHSVTPSSPETAVDDSPRFQREHRSITKKKSPNLTTINDEIKEPKNEETKKLANDDHPVKRLERDLHRAEWIAQGRPGLLDGYVRQKRLTATGTGRSNRKSTAPWLSRARRSVPPKQIENSDNEKDGHAGKATEKGLKRARSDVVNKESAVNHVGQ